MYTPTVGGWLAIPHMPYGSQGVFIWAHEKARLHMVNSHEKSGEKSNFHGWKLYLH